jgi:hypothetical protein
MAQGRANSVNSSRTQPGAEVAVRAARNGSQAALARLGGPGYLKKGRRDPNVGGFARSQASFPLCWHDSRFRCEGPEDARFPSARHLWIVDPSAALNFVGHRTSASPLRCAQRAIRREYNPCCDDIPATAAESGDATAKIVVQQVSEGPG